MKTGQTGFATLLGFKETLLRVTMFPANKNGSEFTGTVVAEYSIVIRICPLLG